MIDSGDHYEFITVYSDELPVLIQYPTVILRGLNTLLPLKGVGEPEFYLGGDVGTVDFNGEVMHEFLARTYIKHVSEKINRSFKTKLKSYGLPLERRYYPEVETSDILVGDEVSR